MEYKRLSECAYYSDMRTKSISFDNYISTENMLPDKGGVTKAGSLPETKSASKYEVNDILLSNIRPYFRKIWLADKEGSCSNDVLVIKSKDGFMPKFLYYVLSDNNFFNYDTVTSKGTKMPRGTPRAIMKYLVPNYKEDKQKAIVNVLSQYDSLIEVNNKRIKLLEQMAEELYKEWFVRFRFPGYETAEFENGLPKGWKVKKVKELVKRLPFGTLYKSEDAEENGNVIIIDQSLDEFVGFHNNAPSHIANIENPIVIFGDHSCKHQLMITPFSLSENVVPYVANDEVRTTYLYYLTHGIVETTEYKRHWSEFVAKKVLVAPINIQDRFVDNVNSNIMFIQRLKNQNRNLIKQRDLLLPRLMSGKLEV